MKIAVNTRLLLENKLEGIGWFTCETMQRITKNHPEHEFIFLFDRKYNDKYIFNSNITPLIIPPPTRHAIVYPIWFDMQLPRIFKKYKPDIYVSPDGYLSLKAELPQLAVFHDLNFEHDPKNIPFFARQHYKYYFKRFARKATRLATVSEYSKQDIVNTYNINTNKIDVVYDGANESFKPIDEKRKKRVRKKYSNDKPYFIYIGSLHPRKNIASLLKAFEKFKSTSPSDIKLIIVGDKMWGNYNIEKIYKAMHFKNDVAFLGRKPREELNDLLGSALALTFVSYFEGFGIPALEAMCCDVPVITSGVSSLPEVCGDAALYVAPSSIDSIHKAMETIRRDEKLRKKLIKKGQTQRAKFTWDNTAHKLWSSIEKCFS